MRRCSASRRRSSGRDPEMTGPDSPAGRAFSGGLASIFSQGLVLRESLYARHEAELATGLAFAAWLLLSGLGGLTAMRTVSRRSWWIAGMTALGIVSPGSAFLCRLGLLDPIVSAAAPGLLAGFVFALPFEPGTRISRICAAEAAGGLAGGVLFCALSSFMLAGGLAAAASLACLAAASVTGGAVPLLLLAAASAAIMGGQIRRLDFAAAVRGPAAGADSFTVAASPRGEVLVSWRSGQASLWRSGTIESYGSAPEAAEYAALVPMAYSGGGRSLYLGSSPDVARLLAEEGPTEVVVPDPVTASIILASAPGAACVPGDERRAVERARGRYDLILLQAGLPLSLLSDRLYTREFFRSCRRALSPDGVVAVQLPVGEARLVPGQAAIVSPIVAAGASVFRSALAFPLGGALLVFSDRPLRAPAEVAARRWSILERLSPVFLNSVSLAWELEPGRLEAWTAGLDLRSGRPNTDLRPLAFLAATRNWYERMGTKGHGAALPSVLGASAALFLVASLFLGRRTPVAVAPWTLGLASTSCETAAILVIQATLGISWTVIALSPALFMCGYAAGSGRFHRLGAAWACTGGSAAAAGFGIACLAYDSALVGWGALAGSAALFVLLSGLFSGSLFPASAALAGGGVRGAVLVNAASVSGSAAGAVAFPLLLFPALGAGLTLVLTGVAAFVMALPAVTAGRGTPCTVSGRI